MNLVNSCSQDFFGVVDEDWPEVIFSNARFMDSKLLNTCFWLFSDFNLGTVSDIESFVIPTFGIFASEIHGIKLEPANEEIMRLCKCSSGLATLQSILFSQAF